jgi:mannose-1-phosphate guanylyltransferase
MNVMLLAAGEGTRLRPYTLTLPKPAIPFLNVPLAGHALRFLGNTPLSKLVVNTFHLAPQIERLFHKLPHKAEQLFFSHEAGTILGSGGGLAKARAHFQGGGDFILMNADEVILPQDLEILEKAIAHHKKTKALATLLVMEHPEAGGKFGAVWTDTNNKVKTFGKERPATGEKPWHFIGVQILSEKVFDYIPMQGESNILYDALVGAMQRGELVQSYPIKCQWFETGNPTDFLAATKVCADILFNENTAAKSSLEQSFQNYLSSKMQLQKWQSADLMFSSEAVIDPSCTLKGFVCVGEGSRIGENCILENVVVGTGVLVPPGTQAANTLLL